MKLPGPPSFRSSMIAALVVATSLAVIALLTGCESRTVTVITPEGITLKYQRNTLGKSNTEGVEIVRDGEGWSAVVEGSGSEPGDVLKTWGEAAVQWGEAANRGVAP